MVLPSVFTDIERCVAFDLINVRNGRSIGIELALFTVKFRGTSMERLDVIFTTYRFINNHRELQTFVRQRCTISFSFGTLCLKE